MKGVILHGGHGTRLRPLTHTGPKQLLTIGDKPMSKYALDDLVEAGITDIAVIIGDVYPEKVKEYYGDGTKFGAKITYVYQQKPGGIAQAINLCRDFVGQDKFVVYLGDNILKGGIREYVSRFGSSQADALILLCEVDDPSRFGIATLKGDRIERIVEKPKNADSNLAVIGVYFLTPELFSIIDSLKPSGRGELEITEALQNLMRNGKRIEYDYVTGWWKDTGTPQDILDANRFMLDELQGQIKGQVESENSIQGRVVVGSESTVAAGAIIRGPVVVGTGCKIGSGVYIGPYTSIGNNVTIRKGELENCIIMDNCEIEVNVRLVDSIVGAGSKILDAQTMSPRGHRFLLGERSQVML
jgi:glucose-1-phosphate thymidylyltransferase